MPTGLHSEHRPPLVSIILPTYNRIDTLSRAIDSIKAQTLQDWELIVVDDGSSDGTDALFANADPRIRYIQQPNAGVAAARNTGLQASTGQFITFLDSDDAWYPYFLQVTTEFLTQHPDQHFVTTEFHQDFGDGVVVRHNQYGLRNTADYSKQLGLTDYELPAGETDDYLRVYSRRSRLTVNVGTLDAPNDTQTVNLYQGNIFSKMRWGYLNWLPITMLTRHAYETVGLFSTAARSAEDYHFLGRVASIFQCNMIALPCAIKYEKNDDGKNLSQGHLAAGSNAYRFEANKLYYFDALFSSPYKNDPVTHLLRCRREIYAAYCAARAGLRHQAIAHLKQSACGHATLRHSYLLLGFLQMVPSDRLSALLLNGWLRVTAYLKRKWVSPQFAPTHAASSP